MAAARPPLRLVRCAQWPIWQQLQLEETLLRGDSQNWCILNTGHPDPVVVMGIGGKLDKLVDLPRVQRDGVPVIKRYSGGGTVVVDEGTMFVSLLINKAARPEVKPFPRDIMSWTETVYRPAFDAALKDPSVPFVLREHDYTIGDKKIAGNAQTITKDRWMHHTSFLWSFQAAHMRYLLQPENQPDYRRKRDHTAFLDPLHAHIKSPQAFWGATMEELGKQFTLVDTPLEEAQAVAAATAGTHRRANRLLHLTQRPHDYELPVAPTRDRFLSQGFEARFLLEAEE